MSLDNPKGIESSVSNTQPRRKFLKKASAGALITSLPAHSVWGNTCSVSGAMSGNLSGTGGGGGPVCDQPELFEGRSPGSWKQFFATGAVHSDIQKMHSMFSYVGESWQANGANADSPGGVKAAKRTCVFNDVKNTGSYVMQIDSDLIDPLTFETKISTALSTNGGLDFNIAAVWLNVFFQMESGLTTVNNTATADAVVNALLAYMKVTVDSGGSLPADDILFGFDESDNGGASSAYIPTGCVLPLP